MRNQLQRSRWFRFQMPKCAIALVCCAFSVEPLFAQEVDWPYFGADLGNSRYANIDLINPSNVSQLKVAWSFTGSGGEAVSVEATPIVVDGVMYVTGNNGGVFAVNPTTGKQIWHYTSTSPGTSKGVVYGNGMLFYGQGNAFGAGEPYLVALNAKTGALVWQTLADPNSATNHAEITITPQFIDAGGVPEVIVSPSYGDFGVRGHVDAYNAATGKLLWRFWTTEPATWGGGNTYLIGGAAVWQTPTFDPALNMVIFGTGNAAGPDVLGTNRAGANLYSDSVVALDATSGELQWFFQLVHHDLWDMEPAQPVMLFSWNGIPAVEVDNKAGYTFILDRASGESFFPYQEVAVPPTAASVAAYQHPWPTQPVSSIESLAEFGLEPGSMLPAGAVAVPEFTTPSPTRQVYQPNLDAGYEWYSAAYSPRTQMIYSHAIYTPSMVSVDNDFTMATCQELYTLYYNGCGAIGGLFAMTALQGGIVAHGVYGAINTLTGKVAWSIPILTTTPSSGMTVAGDLVFFGDATGLFYAASAATGEILWVSDTVTVPGAGGADSTGPIAYEVGGAEYVAMEFGGGKFVQGNALIAYAIPAAVAAAKAKTVTAEKTGTLAERARVR
jgi:quinohemoprotein ethanol dehydrogenase